MMNTTVHVSGCMQSLRTFAGTLEPSAVEQVPFSLFAPEYREFTWRMTSCHRGHTAPHLPPSSPMLERSCLRFQLPPITSAPSLPSHDPALLPHGRLDVAVPGAKQQTSSPSFRPTLEDVCFTLPK